MKNPKLFKNSNQKKIKTKSFASRLVKKSISDAIVLVIGVKVRDSKDPSLHTILIHAHYC